jgi:hypothetical protein
MSSIHLFMVHKTREISLLAERLVACQEGLRSMELLNETYDNTYIIEVYYIKISQKMNKKLHVKCRSETRFYIRITRRLTLSSAAFTFFRTKRPFQIVRTAPLSWKNNINWTEIILM